MHRFAYDAARAAECAADQGMFEEMHAQLYKTATLDRLSLLRAAEAVGVADTLGFRTCVESEAPIVRVERDMEVIRELGATGTPAVAVNGTLYGTRPDSAELEKMLDELRAERGTEPRGGRP